MISKIKWNFADFSDFCKNLKTKKNVDINDYCLYIM